MRQRRRSRHHRGKLVVALAIACIAFGAWYHWRATAAMENTQPSTTTQAATKEQTASKAQVKRTAIEKRLQAYLDTVGKDQTVSVTFKNLPPTANSTAASDPIYSKGSLNASTNGDLPQTAASTYKLYIAAYLFGNRHSFTDAETTSFNNMIINSANDFGESVLSEYGAETINAYLKTRGYNGVFQSGSAATTTSNDLTELLGDLQAGTGAFADATNRSWLLADMAKQVYRTGIPAALGEDATVQDKVGFLNDVNNDAAIVTTKEGYRFILVIMTHGHDQATLDFSRIKAIAEKVSTLAYG